MKEISTIAEELNNCGHGFEIIHEDNLKEWIIEFIYSREGEKASVETALNIFEKAKIELKCSCYDEKFIIMGFEPCVVNFEKLLKLHAHFVKNEL